MSISAYYARRISILEKDALNVCDAMIVVTRAWLGMHVSVCLVDCIAFMFLSTLLTHFLHSKRERLSV